MRPAALEAHATRPIADAALERAPGTALATDAADLVVADDDLGSVADAFELVDATRSRDF